MASTQKPLSWGPYNSWMEWLRGLAITLAGATFLSIAGAFGSSALRPIVRFPYWLGLMVLGWLWGVIVSNFFFGRAGRERRLWLRVIISTLLISVPYSGVVGFATARVRDSRYDTLPDVVDLFVSTTLIAGVMITINVLVGQGGATTKASSQPPKFLERLPLKLRGAEVWAVEAEDHYLRLHTSKGQDLILMRLSDAISELEGIEGAQVHRSWWVAREAITDAARGDGRATLMLRDGAEVPVSRTYARQLRQRNWI